MQTRAPLQPRWPVALAGVGLSALLLVLADLLLLPRFLPLPRDVWLMGWAIPRSELEDVPLNGMGFTGDDVRHAKPAGAARMLTLGGSVLFNRGLTQRLRAQLAPLAPGGLELLGAGIRAHTSWSSRHKYGLLRPYGFDVVLIYEGINDLYASHIPPERFREDYAHLGPWYVRGWLLDRSVIARLVYQNFLHRPAAGVAMGSGHRSVDVLRENLRWLVRAVREDGGVPVLSTFAWAIAPGYTQERFVKGAAGYANPERYDYCPVELWGPEAWVREGLVRINVAIHQVAAEERVPLLDMERLLGRDLRLFGDVCHPSEAGVDAFVGHVRDFLRAERLLEPRPGQGRD